MEKQLKAVSALKVSNDEIWVMGRHSININVIELGDSRPEILICISPRKEMIIGTTLTPPEASDSEVLSWALDCMLSPMMGEPRRPESIVLTENRLNFLAEYFEKLGIDVSIDSEPDPAIELIIASIENEMGSNELHPYLAESGLDPNLIGEFFQAAADLYEIKPWKFFESEVPIRVSLHNGENRSYWAVVMGMAGQEFGLSIYRSSDDLLELFDSENDEEAIDASLKIWTIGFSYKKVADIGEAAQAEYKFNKWPVADSSAYPLAIVGEPERVRRPNDAEMKDFVAVIRALNVLFKDYEDDIINKYIIEEKISGQRVLDKPYTASIAIPAPEFFALYEVEDEDQEE